MKSSCETSGRGLWLMTVRSPESRACMTHAQGTPRPGHTLQYFVRTPDDSRASRKRSASVFPPREAMSMGSTSPNEGDVALSWARRERTWPDVPPRDVWTACARDTLPGRGYAGRRRVWVKKTVPVAKIRSGRVDAVCECIWPVSRLRRAMSEQSEKYSISATLRRRLTILPPFISPIRRVKLHPPTHWTEAVGQACPHLTILFCPYSLKLYYKIYLRTKLSA